MKYGLVWFENRENDGCETSYYELGYNDEDIMDALIVLHMQW